MGYATHNGYSRIMFLGRDYEYINLAFYEGLRADMVLHRFVIGGVEVTEDEYFVFADIQNNKETVDWHRLSGE